MTASAPALAGTPRDAPASARTRQMLHGPLLPTLLRLATPNIVGLFATTLVIGYDGFILGRLGADALAGVALVFPLSMLMLQMSAGGIGGATTAAVARALGAGRRDDADRLAQQAVLVACAMAALFTLVMLGPGQRVYALMGGRGAALADALAYSNLLFGGAAAIWLTNVLAAVVRGTGNMLLPGLMLSATALVHLVLCPLLAFGWGGFAGLGVAGAAASTLASNALAGIVLAAIAFGFGTALTTLVATNLGAGQASRALRVAWLGAAVVAAITGAIGVTAALAPSLWLDWFSRDAAVIAFGAAYLNVVGAAYACFGLGLALFFASQGAGRMFWPLVGSAARLLVVALGGWLVVRVLQMPAAAFFWVVALSLVVYAATIAVSIWRGAWSRQPRAATSAPRAMRA